MRTVVAGLLLCLAVQGAEVMGQDLPTGYREQMLARMSGSWLRVPDQDCAAAYPESLTIRAEGTYIAEQTDDAFREWQAGDFDVREEDTIHVQLSNDRMAPYRFELSMDTLIVTDANECRIEYRRRSR